MNDEQSTHACELSQIFSEPYMYKFFRQMNVLQLYIKLLLFLTLLELCKNQSESGIPHKFNIIDSLQSAQQIQDFIVKLDSDKYAFKVNQALKYDKMYSDFDCEKVSDSLHIKPWQKADFDHNGLTDILVVGNWSDHHILCILDKGENHFEQKSITRRSFQDCSFAVVENNKIEYFFLKIRERNSLNKPRTLQQITLVYESGDFVEENTALQIHKISKIEFSTSGCFGTCPIYELTLNSDKSAKWFADTYNVIDGKEVNGNFTSKISEEKYSEILHVLNYSNFTKLRDDYAVPWTDDQSSTLIITYDNGKVKTINDYGMMGTYGLNRVYQLLSVLRTNQQWKKL